MAQSGAQNLNKESGRGFEVEEGFLSSQPLLETMSCGTVPCETHVLNSSRLENCALALPKKFLQTGCQPKRHAEHPPTYLSRALVVFLSLLLRFRIVLGQHFVGRIDNLLRRLFGFLLQLWFRTSLPFSCAQRRRPTLPCAARCATASCAAPTPSALRCPTLPYAPLRCRLSFRLSLKPP